MLDSLSDEAPKMKREYDALDDEHRRWQLHLCSRTSSSRSPSPGQVSAAASNGCPTSSEINAHTERDRLEYNKRTVTSRGNILKAK